MKKFKISTKVAAIIGYCMLAVLFFGCKSNRPEPIDNYKNYVIYEKKDDILGKSFKIKKKTKENVFEFETIYVLDFDYNKFNVGDTIK